MIRHCSAATAILFALTVGAGNAQQAAPPSPSQPPPFTVPNPLTPSVTDAPGQQSQPAEQQPEMPPNAPLPQTDKTVDLRATKPLVPQPAVQPSSSEEIRDAVRSTVRPQREAPSGFNTHLYNLIAPYKAAHVSDWAATSPLRVAQFVRDGKLYLSLHDAIVLAIKNNLDVELNRYNLLSSDYDLVRAQGGGNLRGIDYSIQQSPPGVGAATSPLLITSTTGTNSPTNAAVTDLSQVKQTGSGTEETFAESGAAPFSSGPAVPLFDPTIFSEASYFRRSNTISLDGASTGSASTTGGASTSTGPLDFVSTGADLQQGFSWGTQLEVFIDNASQLLYGSSSQYNPFHAPSTYTTLSQPLLRGFGRGVNLRFVHIAQINQKVSRLLFEQQLLETIYGVSRLYFDLVSLGENIGVKEESLAAAQKLFDDDSSQVEQGTLAPIELTRARALLSSSRLDLIQAQGEYRQQEVILKEQLLRKLGEPDAYFTAIIPTDRIVVPEEMQALDVPALTTEALADRPDLAQASLQVKADEISVKGSKNGVKPLVNAYANVQTRGSTLVPPETLGSAGTGAPVLPSELTEGGLRLSTIYQGGVQVTLPLRNRIAQADAARDTLQLRQAQVRTAKLENDVRQQIENAAVALENAHQTYAASVESANYQQQLLQAEIDKFSVGESTNYMIVQDEAYLAQARSTEVAARSDWMKARLALDRALGNLLEKNGILLDDAIRNEPK
jgi:outer membrane protein